MAELTSNRLKAITKIGEKIIMDMLDELNKPLITSGLILTNHMLKVFADVFCKNLTRCSYKKLNLQNDPLLDLLISFFDISFAENINLYMEIISRALKKDGVFLGCFIGEKSFFETRLKLLQIEETLYGKCHNRIMPMIRLEDYIKLLNLYGFKNVISFVETIKLKDTNIISNLKLLQSITNNYGQEPHPPEQIGKEFYKHIVKDKITYEENIEIICFIASSDTKKFATQINI